MDVVNYLYFQTLSTVMQGSSLNGKSNSTQDPPSNNFSEPLSTDFSAIITSPPSPNTTSISSAPTPSVNSLPKPSFPSPKQSKFFYSTNTVQAQIHSENTTIFDSPVRSPTRETLVSRKSKLPEKSSQTEPIKTKVAETCNICLSVIERGHLVGCNKARCGYWVHDRCTGFFFSSASVIKKTKFMCPFHR